MQNTQSIPRSRGSPHEVPGIDASTPPHQSPIMINPPFTQAFALLRQGQMQSAGALMAQTLRTVASADIPPLDRGDANAQFTLALGLSELRRHDEAEPYFERAAQLHASYAEARFTLGDQCFDGGNFESAARHYSAYAKRYPRDVQGWINLGLSWMHVGDWQRARGPLERAVALAPDRPKPAAMLADTLKQLGTSLAERLPILQRAAALNPGVAQFQFDLACALFAKYPIEEAKIPLRRALQIEPNNLAAQWCDFEIPDRRVFPDQATRDAYLARWRGAIARFLAIDWGDPEFAAQANDVLAVAKNFHLAYLGLPLVEEHRQHAEVVRRMVCAAAPGIAEIAPHRIGEKRRKIAIVSPYLCRHSVNRVWSGALQALDSTQFELGAFYLGDKIDESIERWRKRADRFESGMRSANKWLEALRDFQPDILVYLDIGLDHMMQLLASLRLAPVQVATWAHPVTSGMRTIDYFLSANACEPANGESHYSETLVRLPHLGTYLDLPEPPIAHTAVDDGKVRLICVQPVEKLHPGHDELFARILAAAPNATLDILCQHEMHDAKALATRMRGAFAKAGVDFDARCRTHPHLPVLQYREFLARADICLDSLDFSGGVSSFDSLWQDLPIVTLPGELMRGRQTFGMLKLLGLDELIAHDADDYVRIATRLAQDADWRASLGARIAAEKMKLYRDQSVVDALAQFLGAVEPPAIAAKAAGGLPSPNSRPAFVTHA